VQWGGVEPGEHHVLDDHDLEGVVGVLEAVLDDRVLGVAAHVLGDRRAVRGGPGVHDLDDTAVQFRGVPVGAQRHDRRVQPRADLPGGPHHQRLAGHEGALRRPEHGTHRRAPRLPVRHEVLGQPRDPRRGPVDGVDDGDGGFDPRPLGVVESGGGLVGRGVDRVFGEALGHLDLHESALEVHGHGCAVLDGAGEVVDVDVVAEHLAGVAVLE